MFSRLHLPLLFIKVGKKQQQYSLIISILCMMLARLDCILHNL